MLADLRRMAEKADKLRAGHPLWPLLREWRATPTSLWPPFLATESTVVWWPRRQTHTELTPDDGQISALHAIAQQSASLCFFHFETKPHHRSDFRCYLCRIEIQGLLYAPPPLTSSSPQSVPWTLPGLWSIVGHHYF